MPFGFCASHSALRSAQAGIAALVSTHDQLALELASCAGTSTPRSQPSRPADAEAAADALAPCVTFTDDADGRRLPFASVALIRVGQAVLRVLTHAPVGRLAARNLHDAHKTIGPRPFALFRAPARPSLDSFCSCCTSKAPGVTKTSYRSSIVNCFQHTPVVTPESCVMRCLVA